MRRQVSSPAIRPPWLRTRRPSTCPRISAETLARAVSPFFRTSCTPYAAPASIPASAPVGVGIAALVHRLHHASGKTVGREEIMQHGLHGIDDIGAGQAVIRLEAELFVRIHQGVGLRAGPRPRLHPRAAPASSARAPGPPSPTAGDGGLYGSAQGSSAQRRFHRAAWPARPAGCDQRAVAGIAVVEHATHRSVVHKTADAPAAGRADIDGLAPQPRGELLADAGHVPGLGLQYGAAQTQRHFGIVGHLARCETQPAAADDGLMPPVSCLDLPRGS